MSRPRDFWSRRKARVEAEAAEDARRAEEVRADAVAGELAEKTDAEILAEYGLPDPDELVPGDGIAGFMRREIPERLRRRALRTLWRSNPVLACVDGLNDYDGDYTNAATDMPGVKTAYQIGKGMKAHVEALAAQEEAKAAALQPRPEAPSAEDAPAPAETAEPTPVRTAARTGVAEQADAPEPIDAAAASATKVAEATHGKVAVPSYTDDGEPPLRPRRMRFRFEEIG
ncbi:Protein of unknown function [Roseivivax lentus]|uniref:DUF3306 domain-containing protein n=1 Tax=Roseivivax lentus TaxID=633194 RepID=A0A1N7NES3_9RHOB|nr:DUF3306 domain-containing protein [Roseivivax lentus]SIS96820.1 Protein of unknown function [Roseivivax lentus]